MTGQVGGAYAALMGKKNKGGNNNNQSNKPAVKQAKVVSLKDSKDNLPKSNKKAEKPQQPAAPKKEKAPERELSKRERKDDRNSNDRHAPRQGYRGGGKHRDAVKEANVEPAEETEEQKARREEWEAKDAARAAEEEAEAKKITFADYEKQLVEKKKELGVKDLKARKVEGPAKMVTLAKDDAENDSALDFTVKKGDAKKGREQNNVAKKDKKKFNKANVLDIGFKVAVSNPPRERKERGDRPPRGPRPERKEAPKAEAPAAEEEKKEE